MQSEAAPTLLPERQERFVAAWLGGKRCHIAVTNGNDILQNIWCGQPVNGNWQEATWADVDCKKCLSRFGLDKNPLAAMKP